MRRMNVPPWPRANAQGNSAERMLPRCRKPVGLGAKRVRTDTVYLRMISRSLPERAPSAPATRRTSIDALERHVADIGRAGHRRRHFRVGRARERNVAARGEQSRCRVEPDPAGAGNERLGPRVQAAGVARAGAARRARPGSRTRSARRCPARAASGSAATRSRGRTRCAARASTRRSARPAPRAPR